MISTCLNEGIIEDGEVVLLISSAYNWNISIAHNFPRDKYCEKIAVQYLNAASKIAEYIFGNNKDWR